MLIVSVERNKQLKAAPNQTHAELVLPSQVPKEGSIQRLWKEYSSRDEDDHLVRRKESAGIVTVLHVECPVFYNEVSYAVAQTCGFKSTQALQEAWVARHPRADRVGIVWFVLGDWRDLDTYLAPTGTGSGDYTTNRARALDPDAPVPPEVADAYAAQNRLKDEARRAQAAAVLAAETRAERARRIFRLIEHLRMTVGEEAARSVWSSVRQHFRVIDQRVTRGEGRK